jgi:hypothetical protein
MVLIISTMVGLRPPPLIITVDESARHSYRTSKGSHFAIGIITQHFCRFLEMTERSPAILL